jgi:membrane fusion protein (multidrug efflux system)
LPDSGIFRKEALEALDDQGRGGELLHLSPAWTRWAYWLLVFVIAGSLSFASFATVGEYASGPAVVRVDGKTDLTATMPGTVAGVEVQPGQHVTTGQLLVRFYSADEQAELERLQSEFEGQLIKVLRDPSDQAARTTLTTLRAQKDQAESRVARRSVRAPRDGVVSDVRIRPGQLLGAGDLVMSILGDDARFSVIVLLPGQYRPLLHSGMSLDLRLSGFPRAVERTAIQSVGDDVVGPAEAKRYLGPELADALPVTGSIVLVKARLSGRTFVSDDKTFSFYDGLPGTAEVRVRSQRVLSALVPGLRWILRDGG